MTPGTTPGVFLWEFCVTTKTVGRLVFTVRTPPSDGSSVALTRPDLLEIRCATCGETIEVTIDDDNNYNFVHQDRITSMSPDYVRTYPWLSDIKMWLEEIHREELA